MMAEEKLAKAIDVLSGAIEKLERLQGRIDRTASALDACQQVVQSHQRAGAVHPDAIDACVLALDNANQRE